jgi:hypothetical protein
LAHVHSWYDALFDDLADSTKLENRNQVRLLLIRNRVIQAYGDTDFSHERLDDVLTLYADKAGYSPKAILIDGFDWESGKVVERAAEIGAFKLAAKRLGAELWMSAQTHRDGAPAHPTALVPPCDAYNDVIDVAFFLEPEGTHASVRLLKDHDNADLAETHLRLDTDTMRIASDDDPDAVGKLKASSFTLLSGGAKGSEAAFGEAAERWGLHEINFSYPGRETTRKRGIVELNEVELERGAVSETYVKAQLHRSFPKTQMFQRLLKTVWHQVATAGEVFVIGEILDDDTVKGGTGWGAELARHFHKRLHVFDQKKDSWFRWNSDNWEQVDTPKIQSTRFTGSGTRELSESGQKAIRELFEKSFGPAAR